jgi:hypothetical protein
MSAKIKEQPLAVVTAGSKGHVNVLKMSLQTTGIVLTAIQRRIQLTMACRPESVNGGKDASSTDVLVWLSQVLPGVEKIVDQVKAHAPMSSSTAAHPSARGRFWFWSAQPNQILTIRTDRLVNRSSK